MIFSLFKRRSAGPNPYPLYQAIVKQARQVPFYRDLDVDDSLDGRFDMITLHAFLVFDALGERDAAAAELSQATFDLMFQDMDHSLRERGVGDVSVPKKVKKMGEVFYGRSDAYRTAIASGEHRLLAAAIYRNVYAGEGEPAMADRLADYVLSSVAALKLCSTDKIRAGRMAWPQIPVETADANEGARNNNGSQKDAEVSS